MVSNFLQNTQLQSGIRQLCLCATLKEYFLKLCFSFLLFFPIALSAQNIWVKGLVKGENEEDLPMAHVMIFPDSAYTSANLEGHFSLEVPSGAKEIHITYTGYETVRKAVQLDFDTAFTFFLTPSIDQLKEVTVTTSRYSQRHLVHSTRTGTHTLSRKDFNSIPVFGGEADVIKALQLLPGTVRGVEGTTDMFVRGGGADQNQVLLDGASLYNTGHLFGFLSVFNPDILEKAEVITGGFPAEYGGRLSSVLDITSLNRIASKTRVSGEVGLISSRVFVETPLVKDKASFYLAGRRTYLDQVMKVIDRNIPYFFYDLNGKLILKAGKSDQLAISYFGGKDYLDLFMDRNEDGTGINTYYISINKSQSVQWSHQYPNEWKSDLTLTHSSFLYDTRNGFKGSELFAASDIEDYSAKVTFEKNGIGEKVNIKTGMEWIRHDVSPNIINTSGFFSDIISSSSSKRRLTQEIAAHVQQEWQLSPKILLNTGLRGSLAVVSNKNYFTPEPRLSFRYALPEDQAIKVSYSRMAQYMHRISNSALSSPTDLWYPVTKTVRPQKAHQIAAAWQKFYRSSDVFASVEGYYKTMSDLMGYREGTNLFLNNDFESMLVQGQGRAYGAEFLLRKEAGKLTGWLSYTLSWSWRQYNGVNEGNWFRDRYDRRHNGALVMQYAFNRRWSASMVWEYLSGARFTPVIGQYVVPSPTLGGVDMVPVFARINQVKLSDTHRLDLGIKYRSNAGSVFKWHLFAGVNNVYNRASPIGIMIEQDETDGSLRYSQPGLFGFLPFVSFGFSF